MDFMESRSCRLSEIDFTDRSFPFSFGELPQKLIESIKQVGLLQPPLLQTAATGYKIVCGRRRLEALRRSGAEDGVIKFFAAPAGQVMELFRRALWENLAQREFNPVEIADIYAKALEIFSKDELLREIKPALEIPKRERFHKRYQAIAGFSPELRELLAAGIMDPESVDLIAGWSDSEIAVLIKLIVETGLRRNKLREVINRLDDLARRDRISPCEPLTVACAAVRDAEGKIDISALRNQLKVMLYPHLTAARKNFAEKLEKLSLPADIRLDPPPDFEGGEYRLSFSFSDRRQWQEACEKLNSIAVEDIDEICSRS
jgi:ParB family chromosome partitioning protein